MDKIIVLVFFSVVLFSCADVSESEVVFDEIVGLWDVRSEEEEEFIYEIRDNGDMYTYRFEDDCYYFGFNEIDDLGNSEFLIRGFFTRKSVRITKTGSTLKARSTDKNEQMIQTWTSSSKRKEDILPICFGG